jgi:RND family efflux transporter MFP subunit
MNKSSLLDQLRIARDDETSSGGGHAWRWWAGGGLAVIVLIAAIVWFFFLPSGVSVRAASALATSSVGVQPGASLLDASGYVVARRQATVSAKITGKVQTVLIEEGDRVAAGQIIAQLDDSNARAALNLANANLEAARFAVEDNKPIYARNERLQGNGYVSRESYDTAKTSYDAARANLDIAERSVAVAQVNLDDTVIRAPFAGVVTDKAAQPGEMVSPITAGSGFTRTGIATIVDMNSLEVDVDVAESFINRVHPGMPATVSLSAYPDWEIPAAVIAVIPTADRSKATVSVRVGFKSHDSRIVPEMSARVAFLDKSQLASPATAARSVIVPADAVQTDASGTSVVFVISGATVERRAVRLGTKRADGQIIVAGLSPGDQVAETSASLSDGERVHIDQDQN